MEIRQLRSFIAVAELLHFRKAAQRLYITQPALSRQVRQLEEELGAELLIRNRKTVRLTDCGRALLKQARIVIRDSERLVQVISQTSQQPTGRVSVGVATALAESVRRVVVGYTGRFPRVDVQCRDMFSTLQNQALRAREIDVAFLRPPVDQAHVVSELLFREPFLVILPKSSPLAKRKKLRLREIADQPLFLPKRAQSIGAHDKVLELYRAAGVKAKVVHTATLPEHSGGMLVESGRGIYIVPGTRMSHPDFGRGTTAVLLDEPDAFMEVHMAWRIGETSTPVLQFIEAARQVFRSAGRQTN